MIRFALGATLGAMLLLMVPASEAQRFTANNLSGANENPANASPGTGRAVVDLNTTTHTLHVNVTFSGLTTGTTASHIHCCIAPFGNAGVATTTPTFAGFPLGVTSGTFDTTLDMTQATSWNPAFITANGGTTAGAEAALVAGLNNNLAYLNVHTTQNPGGEIRGWLLFDGGALSTVPTISQWALIGLALALGGLGFVAMRRRAG